MADMPKPSSTSTRSRFGRTFSRVFSASRNCSATYSARRSAVVLATGRSCAIAPRKDPAAVGEPDFDLLAGVGHADGRMFRGQKHPMVQFGQDRPQQFPQDDEVDHALLGVQRAFDFGRHAVVVPVQPFAVVRRPP